MLTHKAEETGKVQPAGGQSREETVQIVARHHQRSQHTGHRGPRQKQFWWNEAGRGQATVGSGVNAGGEGSRRERPHVHEK